MIKNWEALFKDQQLLIDYHDDPMVISDINGKILAINNKLAKIFGEDKENLIGKSGFKYIGRNVIRSRKNALDEVLKTKKPISFVDYDKNRWWSTKIKPILDNNRNVVKLAIFIKDISKEKESKDFMKYLSDQALMGIMIVQENNIAYVNDALSEITGYSKIEILKRGISLVIEAIHPDDKDFVLNQLKKKLAGDKDVINRYRFKLISKNRSIKWLELYSKTIIYKGENADFINIIDVTEEKIKEEKLMESQNKWNSLVQNIPETDRVIIVDRNYNIIYVNRQYPGYEKNLIGQKFYNLVDKNSIEIMKSSIKEVFEKGISKKYDLSVTIPSGEKKFFQSVAAPIKKDNKIIAALCIAIDNTKLRKIEKNLKINVKYMNRILNSASEIIFTINSEKKIVIWNKSAEKKTGFYRKNILNKSIKNTRLFEDPSLIENFIDEKINRKKSILPEIMINTKKGNKLLLAVSSSEIKNENNQITDILFVCWDITHDIIKRSLSGYKSYILFDQNIINSMKLFNQNIMRYKKGLIITRNINKINEIIKDNKKVKLIQLSSLENKKIETISNITEFKKQILTILNKNKNVLILIDRLDYLISTNSFEKFILSLYDINDNIKNLDSTIILRINSNLLTQNQRLQLEQEFNMIPKKVLKK